MIYYYTSKDSECRIVIDWCREHNYIYKLDGNENRNDFCVYPFSILAPSYMEKDLMKKLDKEA